MSDHVLKYETVRRARSVAVTNPGTWQFTTELNGRAFVEGGKLYEIIAGVRAVRPFPGGYTYQAWGVNPKGAIRRAICNSAGEIIEVCRYV